MRPNEKLTGILFLMLAACGGAVAPSGDARDGNVEPGAGGASDPRCLPQGGYADDDCDRCENAFCCGPRFACYDDRNCDAAADTLDACIDRTSDPSVVQHCWDAFKETGPRADARVDCMRAHCASVCEVPH
jgi:hypothetical protein